ncbi:MAG: helix-turn-helix transcriptional regulator [Planctomyces sp.]
MKKRRSSPATDIRQSTSGNTSRRRMPAAATPPNISSPPPVAALRTQPPTEQPRWTFLTNHAHVLVLLWQNPAMIVREVARQVGITERAVQHILAELENAGILQRTRVGRQNRYHIETSVPLRHPIESHRTIGELLQLCARTQHT